MTVLEFMRMIEFNESHRIRVKDSEGEHIILETSDFATVEKSIVRYLEIKEFSTDWFNRVYILWV